MLLYTLIEWKIVLIHNQQIIKDFNTISDIKKKKYDILYKNISIIYMTLL